MSKKKLCETLHVTAKRAQRLITALRDPSNPNPLPPPPEKIISIKTLDSRPKAEKRSIEKSTSPVLAKFLVSKQEAVPPPLGTFSSISFEKLDLEHQLVYESTTNTGAQVLAIVAIPEISESHPLTISSSNSQETVHLPAPVHLPVPEVFVPHQKKRRVVPQLVPTASQSTSSSSIVPCQL